MGPEERHLLRVANIVAVICFTAALYHFLHQLPTVYLLLTRIPLDWNGLSTEAKFFFSLLFIIRASVCAVVAKLAVLICGGIYYSARRFHKR